MEKRQFGSTDMRVSLLGFGGAELGYEAVPQDTVNTLLNSALDAGLNVIDTAECYLNSEELIGKAVAGRRDQFYLFTKCGHEDDGSGGKKGKWDKATLLKSVQRSLKLLQTDVLDLVQLHSCSLEDLEKGEVIEAMQEARDKGYTRYIGYSGDSQAARYAIECGAFDSLQTSINIADQEAIDFTIPLARERKMGVIAKRPVANAAWRTGKKPEEPYHHAYWERLQKLKYPFLDAPLEESIAIAMRFTASIPGVHTMIVGTTRPGRWSENAHILEAGPLPKDQFDAIRSHWNNNAPADWTGET
jgi:aryl-alcohol dehydrogenase-like predicted oxidoreductase